MLMRLIDFLKAQGQITALFTSLTHGGARWSRPRSASPR
jgi:hypothetical protein